jgi:Tfp pilus assembly protein PilF
LGKRQKTTSDVGQALAASTTAAGQIPVALQRSASAAAASSVSTSGPWLYRPWLDLLVGCGAWSAPLLAIAMWMAPSTSHFWVVAFYLLAIVFNYPHFMATVYRAYHTREDFEKYKFFTLHLTLLLALTGVLLHLSYRLFPWVFTLYICWSPWHYTGQNYGLLMMFVRRSGAQATLWERRWMRAAFVASYLMLLASFETGGSNDPLILSLGLPARLTLLARVALGGAFGIFVLLAFDGLIRRHGFRAMVAPLTLALTQFLWFVLPTFLELRSTYHVPQTRYSSGILAVLHSAQYIWVTSYYQRREARAAGESGWRMARYFVTLIAGGIALFIPGPWLVSYAFHYDFTTSFLIFMALVNIHHFMLDGALWKLRDSRIASLLVGGGKDARATGTAPAGTPAATTSDAKIATRWAAGRVFSAPAFRIGAVTLLFLWGGLDQVHFALGTDEGNLNSLARAARMNPYDSMTEERIAQAETLAGRKGDAVAALTRAVEINPHRVALQEACARAMIEDGRYEDAYAHYKKMLAIFPNDADALINYGLLAARLGHPEEAVDSWQQAVNVKPDQANAHLYLAEAFDQRGELASAARNWKAYLNATASQAIDDSASASAAASRNAASSVSTTISAQIQLADDEAHLNQPALAQTDYQLAASAAEQAGYASLASLAFAHLADLQEKLGDMRGAAAAYQRGLALDARADAAKSGDARNEATDWFNYGQFLRRRGRPEELVYACLLRAEELLANSAGKDLETVHSERLQIEARLGKEAAVEQKDASNLLARAAGLPAGSF